MRVVLNNPDGSFEVTYSGTLAENKKDAYNIIKDNFDLISRTNVFDCSLGFPVDNRWVGKNDIDNATCAIETWFDNSSVALFRDANNNTQSVSLEALKQLKKEAQVNKLYLLSIKWKREYLVDIADSIDKIWSSLDLSESVLNNLVK